MTDLSPKQRAFVAEYLIDFNATRAATQAGYSERTAESQASRLLRNVKIKAAVEKAIDERNARTRVTADRVVKELARVAFSDMRNFAEWGPDGVSLKSSDVLSTDDSAAVTEISESPSEHGSTLKFKLAHKDSALKLLAQHTGLLDGQRDMSELLGSFMAGVETGTAMQTEDLSGKPD
jgi:phage terminase small subunit